MSKVYEGEFDFVYEDDDGAVVVAEVNGTDVHLLQANDVVIICDWSGFMRMARKISRLVAERTEEDDE